MLPDGEADTENVLHLYFYLTHSMLLRLYKEVNSGIVSTRVNLENVLLNERNQAQNKYGIISLTYGLSNKVKATEREDRMVAARGWFGEGKYLLHGKSFSYVERKYSKYLNLRMDS